MDLVIVECSIWCNDIILYIYKRKLNRWTISLPTYILQRPSKEEKESYHFQTLHISYFPKVAADDGEKSKTAPFTSIWHRYYHIYLFSLISEMSLDICNYVSAS